MEVSANPDPFSMDALGDVDLATILVWHLRPTPTQTDNSTATLGDLMCINKEFYRAAKAQLDVQAAAIRIAARKYIRDFRLALRGVPLQEDLLHTAGKSAKLRRALLTSFGSSTTKWMLPTKWLGHAIWEEMEETLDIPDLVDRCVWMMNCTTPLLLAIANGKCMACVGCKTRCPPRVGGLEGWEIEHFGKKTKPRFYNIDCFRTKTVVLGSNDEGVDGKANDEFKTLVCKRLVTSTGDLCEKEVFARMRVNTHMKRFDDPSEGPVDAVFVGPCPLAEPDSCLATSLGIDKARFEEIHEETERLRDTAMDERRRALIESRYRRFTTQVDDWLTRHSSSEFERWDKQLAAPMGGDCGPPMSMRQMCRTLCKLFDPLEDPSDGLNEDKRQAVLNQLTTGVLIKEVNTFLQIALYVCDELCSSDGSAKHASVHAVRFALSLLHHPPLQEDEWSLQSVTTVAARTNEPPMGDALTRSRAHALTRVSDAGMQKVHREPCRSISTAHTR